MITIVLAFTTLTGIFLFFRIEKVTEILIGDGKSVLDRQKDGQEGNNPYEPLVDKKYWLRLKDAIYRKNIYGVEEGIRRISIQEIRSKEEPGSTGYSKLALPKFIKTKRILQRLKLELVFIFLNSLIAIFLDLCVNGVLFYLKLKNECLLLTINTLYIISIILFMSLIIFAIFDSIFFKTPHEKEKIRECRNLKIY